MKTLDPQNPFSAVQCGMALSIQQHAHLVKVIAQDGKRTEYTALTETKAQATADALDKLTEVPRVLVVSK